MTSGYQSSLLVWASPRMTAAQRAPDPDRRRAEAERLGLQWPEPRVKRGRGPPTFKEKFREAVYQAIRGQKWDVLEQLENAEMHPGWRPGSPLVGSPAGMVAGMAVAEQLAPKEHEEAAPEEEHEEACLDEGDITDRRRVWMRVTWRRPASGTRCTWTATIKSGFCSGLPT